MKLLLRFEKGLMPPMESLLLFLKEIDKLKSISRQTLLHNGNRKENSAEHSWHLAMAVLLFHSHAGEPLDVGKALKMALLHDIVEIDAGDVIIYGDQSQKKEKEAAALARLMAILPEPIAQEFSTHWIEFENQVSAEARFVAALDRFLPVYSNILNQGHSWQEHGIALEQVLQKNKGPIETGFPTLWPIAEAMLNEAVAKGHLKNSRRSNV